MLWADCPISNDDDDDSTATNEDLFFSEWQQGRADGLVCRMDEIALDRTNPYLQGGTLFAATVQGMVPLDPAVEGTTGASSSGAAGSGLAPLVPPEPGGPGPSAGDVEVDEAEGASLLQSCVQARIAAAPRLGAHQPDVLAPRIAVQESWYPHAVPSGGHSWPEPTVPGYSMPLEPLRQEESQPTGLTTSSHDSAIHGTFESTEAGGGHGYHLPSRGSKQHFQQPPRCTPCWFLFSSRDCTFGADCHHCHVVGDDVHYFQKRKRRKKRNTRHGSPDSRAFANNRLADHVVSNGAFDEEESVDNQLETQDDNAHPDNSRLSNEDGLPKQSDVEPAEQMAAAAVASAAPAPARAAGPGQAVGLPLTAVPRRVVPVEAEMVHLVGHALNQACEEAETETSIARQAPQSGRVVSGGLGAEAAQRAAADSQTAEHLEAARNATATTEDRCAAACPPTVREASEGRSKALARGKETTDLEDANKQVNVQMMASRRGEAAPPGAGSSCLDQREQRGHEFSDSSRVASTLADELCDGGVSPDFHALPRADAAHTDRSVRSPRSMASAKPDAHTDVVPDSRMKAKPAEDALPHAIPGVLPDAVPDPPATAQPDPQRDAFLCSLPDALPDGLSDALPAAQPHTLLDALPDAPPDPLLDALSGLQPDDPPPPTPMPEWSSLANELHDGDVGTDVHTLTDRVERRLPQAEAAYTDRSAAPLPDAAWFMTTSRFHFGIGMALRIPFMCVAFCITMAYNIDVNVSGKGQADHGISGYSEWSISRLIRELMCIGVTDRAQLSYAVRFAVGDEDNLERNWLSDHSMPECTNIAPWASQVVVDIVVDHLEEFQEMQALDPHIVNIFKYKVTDWLPLLRSKYFGMAREEEEGVASKLTGVRLAPLLDSIVLISVDESHLLAQRLLFSSDPRMKLAGVSLHAKLGNWSLCDTEVPRLRASVDYDIKPWALMEEAICLQHHVQTILYAHRAYNHCLLGCHHVLRIMDEAWKMSRYSPNRKFQSLLLGTRGSILRDYGKLDAAKEAFSASAAVGGVQSIGHMSDSAMLNIDKWLHENRSDPELLMHSITILHRVGNMTRLLQKSSPNPFVCRFFFDIAVVYDYIRDDAGYRRISEQIRQICTTSCISARAVAHEGVFAWRRREFDVAKKRFAEAFRIRESECNPKLGVPDLVLVHPSYNDVLWWDLPALPSPFVDFFFAPNGRWREEGWGRL